MKLPRRQFLQLTGAAIAAPTVGRIPLVQAEPAFRQVEKLTREPFSAEMRTILPAIKEADHCYGASGAAGRGTLLGNWLKSVWRYFNARTRTLLRLR
jgi:hypothetical protein